MRPTPRCSRRALTLQQDIATEAYDTITAPFDGIVTARYVDPDVVSANNHARNTRLRRDHHHLQDGAASGFHRTSPRRRAIH